MRTNRTTLAAVLSIALAVVPVAVAAQAADEELATPSHWTSTETDGLGFDPLGGLGGGIEHFDWGPRATVGLTYTVEADDPRAAGDLDIVYVYDQAYASGAGRGTGLARLVNDGGTFEGELHVVYYPDGSEFRMALLDGRDGYEGLTYTMTNFLSRSGEGQTQGLIWEGDAPALPDADLLPD